MVNRFGTTSEMIIQEVQDGGITRLLAIDGKGLYFTTQDRVDRGMADVNRYGSPRELVLERLKELGMDPQELFQSNRHRIPSDVEVQVTQKLNPIKASKRR